MSLKRTPFYEAHKNLDAKLIDFGGFEMPVQYQGIKDEHQAVRDACGIFDVSHMGEVFVEGPEALDFVNYITINNASKIAIGQAQYSAMCYENGGIVDDLLVYRLDTHSFMLVINASNIKKDVEWMKQHVSKFDCTLENLSEKYCLLAVQGPNSKEILQKLTSVDLYSIGFYKFKTGDFAGLSSVIISETGYTGEPGFELYFRNDSGDPLSAWNAIMDAGVDSGLIPCGLGARDTLRLEMGYALYGNDITQDTNPLEAKMGWLTKLDKEEFIGKKALQEQKEEGITRKLIGFYTLEKRAIPRNGYPLCDKDGNEIGTVTSGGMSITENKGIGMGYAPVDYITANTTIYIKIRKKLVEATLTKPPFIRK